MNQIDVRTIPPRDRHPLIFQTFDALAVGESFELVNDHAPVRCIISSCMNGRIYSPGNTSKKARRHGGYVSAAWPGKPER